MRRDSRKRKQRSSSTSNEHAKLNPTTKHDQIWGKVRRITMETINHERTLVELHVEIVKQNRIMKIISQKKSTGDQLYSTMALSHDFDRKGFF